jgi:hypothetical protein
VSAKPRTSASSPSAALALGALAAALAALPAVHRFVGSGPNPGVAWLALAGGTALVLGPALALARAADRESPGLRGTLVGTALAALPLSKLAQVLKLETHHRPLGAATFGMLALAVLLASIVFCVRAREWARAKDTRLRRLGLGAVTFAACVSLGLVLLRAFGAGTLRHEVTDGIRVVVVGALAYRLLDLPAVETLARRAGVWAWVVVVVVGLIAARGAVSGAVRERAPVLGGPAAWL